MIPPGATIGIVGGGQLGRMLAMAAERLGYHVHIFCPDVDAPAREVVKHTTIADYDDRDALKRFARNVDVATYEFENIPAEAIRDIARHTHVYPSPEILEVSQHRVREKQAVNALGVATAPFAAVHSDAEFQAAITKIGLPAVLKTARMGYDGKGQWMIGAAPRQGRQAANGDLEAVALPNIPAQGGEYELILEGFVDFKMEISVIVARGKDGKMACYCPVQNTHKNHILAETIAPAPILPALTAKAENIARTIAEGMDLVGIMAIEMFVTKDEKLLVNELAPRPHNSGHWTIDAAATSQFEQTLRAICGLPLGSTERLCEARMVNLIGDDIKDWQKYVQMPGAKLHIYGKKESRPGRKMGHVTFVEP